jgi:hypothetical protein
MPRAIVALVVESALVLYSPLRVRLAAPDRCNDV